MEVPGSSPVTPTISSPCVEGGCVLGSCRRADASGKRLEWLLGPHPLPSPVVKYGFSWEVASGPNAEPWHIRYVCGDEWPPAVEEALEVFPNLKVS